MDTPGIRLSDDVVEQQAIGLAKHVIEKADVLIHMTDMQNGFELVDITSRKPDLHVLNKVDCLDEINSQALPDDILPISAATGQGLGDLVEKILGKLGLNHIDAQTPWAFSEKLKRIVEAADREELLRYMS
jgi:tRNA U34 5-carboxymethylaminomethyl modifying GTPase MnmE/TrmE